MRSRDVLKRDLGIFAEPGFLVAHDSVGVIIAITAWLLVHSANTYGIPVAPYWK
jgi:hypothetical protein